MIKVNSRHMQCTRLTPDFSQMPAVALHLVQSSDCEVIEQV